MKGEWWLRKGIEEKGVACVQGGEIWSSEWKREREGSSGEEGMGSEEWVLSSLLCSPRSQPWLSARIACRCRC